MSVEHSDFKTRFQALTGNAEPFPWQEELFRQFLNNTIERSLDIPTGLGKTAVMAIWLLARVTGASIPRRLVYVVDRRAVVDQATEVADRLRKAVGEKPTLQQSLGLNGRQLPISTLRGQHVDNKQWLEDPSNLAIVVGTIDMIGSRLLFEGYGVSRKMCPYHAGLLGADTLVVLDEAHLVPPFEMLLDAIASDTARVAPRTEEAKAIVPPFKLMALSATGHSRAIQPFTLTAQDLEHPTVKQRLDAKKRLILNPLETEEGKKELTPGQRDELLAVSLAKEAWGITEQGVKAVRVIVYCDERKVAGLAKDALERLARDADQKDIKDCTELFVGGRRVYEREAAADRLKTLGFIAGSKPSISRPAFVFATSAGEVGVDLDADHMVSDLVAWERMIQRLGRVNRRGEGDAKVIVLVEPDPKPEKAAKAAMEKEAGGRDDKDNKAIATHQETVEAARAKRRPFERLPHYEDKNINASLGAIRELKKKANNDEELRAILDAATTPEPLRPALTRAIVDAWSMTSLKEHTGRPEIGPWLRGWIEKDPPQTTVVWRKYLPTRSNGEVTRKEIEAFFEAAPPHTSESLETETYRVFEWLTARAKGVAKREQSGSPIDVNQPVAFVLTPSGDYRCSFTLNELNFTNDEKPANKDQKDEVRKSLAGGMLVVDARLGGLCNGLLDSSEQSSPKTADDGEQWLNPVDGGPVVRFRIRSVNAEANGQPPSDRNWRQRLRFATQVSEENEAGQWLIVEKWRNDSTTEEDRGVGNCQFLHIHQELAAQRADELAKRLNLPEQYGKMLAIAARLHDEGKRSPRWQRAFNAPQDGEMYAKTPGPINFSLLDGYRHEFRSLAVAAQDAEFLVLAPDLRELALHLIAAHHGFARPVIGTSGCDDAPPSSLEARARDVALRFARLQQHWGPWGLAWWESLLRAADQHASRENDAAEAEIPQEVAG